MIDAVKPAVSDEMVEAAAKAYWIECYGKHRGGAKWPDDVIGGSQDLFRAGCRAALLSALAAQGQEPVAGLEEAIRLAEVGEYLYNACAYSYGDGYTEPREYGIEWQWQQSKPDEFGQGQLLAASTRWHQEQASDGFVTEASKLRSAITAPAQPVGVPVGYVSTVELHTLWNIDTCVDLFSMPPDEDGFQFVPVYAAPQPPAEGGWRDIASADKDAESLMLGIVRNGVLEEIHIGGFRYAYNEDEVSCWWSDQCDDEIVPTHWMPLPPAPANGGEQNG